MEEGLGEFEGRGEMEEGEEDLVRLKIVVFTRQGFLHLADHLGPGIDLGSGRGNFRARLGVGLIANPGAASRPLLDEDLMSFGDDGLDPCRDHRHPMLLVLNLLRHPNNHLWPSDDTAPTILPKGSDLKRSKSPSRIFTKVQFSPVSSVTFKHHSLAASVLA